MNYFRPQNLSQALHWLVDNDAAIAAGCTDLFASTQSQYLQKRHHNNLLDITAIEELNTITHGDEGIKIGAGVKWSEIIAADLPAAFDGLKAAAKEVGSVQIQNSASIGGNLCNASPAADGVPPLAILDATVELVSTSGSRNVPILDFLVGPRHTALKRDEILTSIFIPTKSTRGISGFRKLGARKYLIISIAMVAVRLVIEKNRIEEIAISVGSCSAVAVRLQRVEVAFKNLLLEQVLTGETLGELVSLETLESDLSPIDDIRADAAYRITAAREIVVRTITDLIKEGDKS